MKLKTHGFQTPTAYCNGHAKPWLARRIPKMLRSWHWPTVQLHGGLSQAFCWRCWKGRAIHFPSMPFLKFHNALFETQLVQTNLLTAQLNEFTSFPSQLSWVLRYRCHTVNFCGWTFDAPPSAFLSAQRHQTAQLATVGLPEGRGNVSVNLFVPLEKAISFQAASKPSSSSSSSLSSNLPLALEVVGRALWDIEARYGMEWRDPASWLRGQWLSEIANARWVLLHHFAMKRSPCNKLNSSPL